MRTLLIISMALFTWSLNGQKTKTIVKKVEDKEVHVKDAKEKSVSKSLNVEKRMVNGEEVLAYKLTTIEDGAVTVIEWDGEGDMPGELKKELDAKEMDFSKGKSSNNSEKKVIVEIDENGEKKIMEWDGEGEMPEEMEAIIEEHEIEIDEEIIENGGKFTRKKRVKSHASHDVNVKMGIGLFQSRQGVKVDYVDANSPASKAGLQEGDVLLKIGDTYILSEDLVFKALSAYKPNDKVGVMILRDNSEKTINLILEGKEK